MAKKQEIAELGEAVYNTIFSIPSFANVHTELLANILPAVENSSLKRLLVMGIGPSGLPYYNVPDNFKGLFKNKQFKAVFLDYSIDILASCFAKYNKTGIIGKKGLNSQIIVSDKNVYNISSILKSTGLYPSIKPKSEFKEKDLENKLTFFQHDLREPLPRVLGSFDVIESSFTLHHVAQYTETLAARLKEVYTVLDKNGLFHLGEGFCDMGYSEKKIKRIGEDIMESLGYPITLIDKRQANYVYKLTFEPGKEPKLEKVCESALDPSNQIIIDADGLAHFPGKFINISSAKKNDNYSLKFPLISPESKEDQDSLIKPVHDFYAPTNKEIAALAPSNKTSPELIQIAVQADLDELHNAERGLAEYYRSEKDALNLLSTAGFNKIIIKRPNDGNKGFKDLVNILCYKS